MHAIMSLRSSGIDGATISVNATSVVVDAAASESSHIVRARLLFECGFITMLMGLGTVLYKPPRGVLGSRRLAYYLVLAGVFVAGLAEVSAAIWLSRNGRGRRAFMKATLCASMVPLVVVITLGGFRVLLKG